MTRDSTPPASTCPNRMISRRWCVSLTPGSRTAALNPSCRCVESQCFQAAFFYSTIQVAEEEGLGLKGLSLSIFRTALPCGVIAFWIGMWIAAQRYPSEFDWRFMTVSNLVSPAHNPRGHLWASAGVVLCGLCGWHWASKLARLWRQRTPGRLPGFIVALRIGNLCMALSAVLPSRLLRIPKGHEALALIAFIGLCLGIVLLTFQRIEESHLRRAKSARSRLSASLVAGAALFPVFLGGLAQAYVMYVLPQLHWVNLSWRERGVPIYLSFAFWEWSTCIVLSVYLVVLSVLTPAWLSTPI